MIELGGIPLTDDRSVVEARRKIRNLTATAGGDELLATRVATVTSQVARSLIHHNQQPRIDTLLCDQGAGAHLVLDFVGDIDRQSQAHLQSFFDQLQQYQRNGSGSCWRVRIALPLARVSRASVERLQSIVDQKTRDQLLKEIQTKNCELEESLDNLRRTRSAKDRMESELNIGREIQMSMLPLTFPAFPEHKEFDIHAALYPAQQVGGDFYDMFMIDADHLCFCIGDVSGKGVPAALFMAVTKTLIKSRAVNDLSPASILSHVNSEQAEGNDSCMFVTIFLGILNLQSGRLVYCNAGHNPPFVQRSDGSLAQLDNRHGPVIGALEGVAYGEDEIVISAGELAYFYTDGVTEAMDIDRTLYSEKKLRSLLELASYKDAAHAVSSTVDTVWSHQGDADQADDVTVLALRYHGSVTGDTDLHLSMHNQMDQIRQISEAFQEFAHKHTFPKRIIQQVRLCLDELLSNIVVHGYDDAAEHSIDIHLRLLAGELAITITDDGKPFNPFAKSPPDTDLSIEDRPIGGLGVHLVKNFIDHCAYERHGEQNVVHLTKHLTSGSTN